MWISFLHCWFVYCYIVKCHVHTSCTPPNNNIIINFLAHTIFVVFVLSCVTLFLMFSHLQLHLHNISMVTLPPSHLVCLPIFTLCSLSVSLNWEFHFKGRFERLTIVLVFWRNDFSHFIFSCFSKHVPDYHQIWMPNTSITNELPCHSQPSKNSTYTHTHEIKCESNANS